MKQNYLPSKKFIAGVMVITIFIGVIWGIYGIVKFFKNRANRKAETSANLTVSDIIQKDGNTNGIPDWEEYLWGLDPYKNGDSNKEFINNKKKLLSVGNLRLLRVYAWGSVVLFFTVLAGVVLYGVYSTG